MISICTKEKRTSMGALMGLNSIYLAQKNCLEKLAIARATSAPTIQTNFSSLDSSPSILRSIVAMSPLVANCESRASAKTSRNASASALACESENPPAFRRSAYLRVSKVNVVIAKNSPKNRLTGHYKAVYSSDKCFKNTRVGGNSPRQTADFFSSIAFYGQGGASGNTARLAYSRFLNTLSTYSAQNEFVGLKTLVGSSAMNALSIGTTAIRQFDNLYSLNDLHKASGNLVKHEPNNFMRLDTTRDLAEEVVKSADVRNLAFRTIQGRNGGTYVCKELVYAYAMWVSPAFNLKVIRTFDGLSSNHSPSLKNRQWLVCFDHEGRESAIPVSSQSFVTTHADIAKRITQHEDPPYQTERVIEILNACVQRLEIDFMKKRDSYSNLCNQYRALQTKQAGELA